MATVVRNIAGAVNIPVMVDADTGYGNAINAARAVKEFERAGAAGIMIEDQVAPKKCPFIGNQPLISEKEMLGKIRAALDARTSEDFVIRARTDALGQEAIERANSYADAGADMIHAVQRSVEDVEGFPKSIHAPLSIAVMGWKQSYTVEELKRLGYKVAIFVTPIYSVTKALVDFMAEVKNKGTIKGVEDKMVSMEYYEKLVDLPKIKEMEEKYLPKETC
jgi:2-methylisocitrate lyase-like PEP mutase family enzyme